MDNDAQGFLTDTENIGLSFSSNPAHALPCADSIFSELRHGRAQDCVTLDANGFITARVNGAKKIIFWLPTQLQDAYRYGSCFIRRPDMIQMDVGELVELDLSQFVHGKDWTRCYCPRGLNSTPI